MHAETAVTGHRLMFGYYVATGAFLLADYLLGINVRLAFLEGLPGWRLLYYAFCFACLFLVWRFPNGANAVAAAESLVTLSGLILSMGSRVVTVSDAVLEGGRMPVTPEEIVNFLISGTAAYAALWLHGRRLRGGADHSP